MMLPRQFEFRIDSRQARILFVSLVCLGLAVYCVRVARTSWALEQLESYDQTKVAKAIAVDPFSPQLHNWAGTLSVYGERTEPEKAVQEFKTAVNLNYRIADNWANLGRACLMTNDLGCAGAAYERSVLAAPGKPRFTNELATYYMATGDTNRALPHLARLLEIEPSSAYGSLSLALRAIDPDTLWSSVVKHQKLPGPKIEFVKLLSLQGMEQQETQFWSEFASSRPSLTVELVTPYLKTLEAKHSYKTLARVWTDLETLQTPGMPSRTSGNLVVNASFEQAPTNVGFDWHLNEERFLQTSVVPLEQGSALQLDFTVPHNTEHDSAFQLVPVFPGKTYELRFRTRSQNLTSDSGPRLRVLDPDCPSCLDTSSIGTTGTKDWHDTALTFTASPTTELVRISVWRPRSRSFPAEIQGQFWIDDITVRPIN